MNNAQVDCLFLYFPLSQNSIFPGEKQQHYKKKLVHIAGKYKSNQPEALGSNKKMFYSVV